jgi:hypothetical protein
LQTYGRRRKSRSTPLRNQQGSQNDSRPGRRGLREWATHV